MKNYYLLLLVLLVSYAGQAQIVNIPDPAFKNALLNYSPPIDTNGDGEIQVSEAEVVLELNLNNENGNLNISSLEGIQSFTSLRDLNLQQNFLTSLDVSQNLDLEVLNCVANDLNELDVTNNNNLVDLAIDFNNLTSINVSQNINLTDLYCNGNEMTTIDVTNNVNLQNLFVGRNLLNSLDVSQNPALLVISCDDNAITSLDVSQNPNLSILWCYDNGLFNLNVKNGNNSNMITMSAANNPNLSCIQVDDENATYPDCLSNVVGWCIDPWAEYSEDCPVLGINDLELLEISLYPNPVKKVIFIDSPNHFIDSVRVYSLQGQLIMQETIATQLNVSTLESGLYFIQLSAEGKTVTKKFVKQ